MDFMGKYVKLQELIWVSPTITDLAGSTTRKTMIDYVFVISAALH